jgi:hypothetical protein
MIQNVQRTVMQVETEQKNPSEPKTLDPRVLSSVIIASKIQQDDPTQGKDPHERLAELMHSGPINALLSAAESFAQSAGLSPEDGLRQIVSCFRDVDQLWSQVLIKEGLARLSSQYH